MIKRLNKLRSLRLEEVKERTNQYLRRRAESFGLFASEHLLTDEAILPKFTGIEPPRSPDELLARFRNDERKVEFFPSLNDADLLLAEANAFHGEVERIVSSADRIVAGRFSLLGFDDLNFGKPIPDWHLEPLTNRVSPLIHWSKFDELDTSNGEQKLIWELNRHQYFIRLGQAYWLTGDEKYAKTFATHIADWMDRNPPKLGINWLSSLEISFRSISWVWAFHFFRNSAVFTPGLLMRMLKFLYLNGRHIETYLSTYYSPNTHLTGEALGLYILGASFPELKDSVRWKSIGRRVLMEALDYQVRPDGTYCEQSSHYLRYTIDFYCSFLILLRVEGSTDTDKIEKHLTGMFDCLLYTSYPNGESPNFGDDDGGRFHMLDYRAVTDLRPVFALGAVLLGRSDLKGVAGSATTELLWLLGPQAVREFESTPSAKPAHKVKAFPDGGLFTARSGWTDNSEIIVIDCGPHGFLNGGHAHADALNFVLAIGGRPVFIDSGTFTYLSNNRERNEYRGTAAHNCLTIDGEPSAVPAGPFSWKTRAECRLLHWKVTEDGFMFRGSHDGFKRVGVRYEREILASGGFDLSVSEFIECDELKIFQVNWILAPGLNAEIANGSSGVRIYDLEGLTVLTIETSVDGDISGIPVWDQHDWEPSPLYGRKERSKKLVLTVSGRGSLRITNSMIKALKADSAA